MPIELGKLSHSELEALAARIEKQKTRLHREQRDAVRKKLIRIAKDDGYTIEELFGRRGGGKKTGKVAPKYRNPVEPSQTWSGRGKRPRWFVDAINQGKKESDLLI
ncbi:MAG: H-NS histone family protein [Xanthomonadales bacterium]|nr:H-NS histone family protein [Xanthomonadales bacterium]